MPAPREKTAASLEILRALQAGGRRVFAGAELTRVHRDRLVRTGYLQRVIGGWLISTNPTAEPGDSTPWLTAFWEFCGAYCEKRFGAEWHLSPEQSLALHVETSVIPTQVLVFSPKGQNNRIDLLHGTSLLDLRERTPPLPEDLERREGLRLYTLDAASLGCRRRSSPASRSRPNSRSIACVMCRVCSGSCCVVDIRSSPAGWLAHSGASGARRSPRRSS